MSLISHRKHRAWGAAAIGIADNNYQHNALSAFYGEPKCTLLGQRGKLKTDPQHAALLNGIASHVLDYDDTHLDKFIHPTGPVASALLAVADWKGKVSGKDLLLALVAGVETECKLGLSVWPDHYDVGWYVSAMPCCVVDVIRALLRRTQKIGIIPPPLALLALPSPSPSCSPCLYPRRLTPSASQPPR